MLYTNIWSSYIARKSAVVVYHSCAIILSPDICTHFNVNCIWYKSANNTSQVNVSVELWDLRHRKLPFARNVLYVQTWRKKGQHMQLFMRHKSHRAAVINMLVSWQHPHGFIIPSSYSLSPITLSYWRGWVFKPQLFYMFSCSLMSS